jgi:hypothetical protein
MRVAAEIVLLNEERMQLQLWARSKTVSVRLARRAQMPRTWVLAGCKSDAGVRGMPTVAWRPFRKICHAAVGR